MNKPEAIDVLLRAMVKAQGRLSESGVDVVTVAEQLRQTSALVVEELRSKSSVRAEQGVVKP